jgi:two-component system sensor histidine kinase MprB
MPLRNRLTAAAAAAAAIAIVGVVSVAYVAVRHELLNQVDSQLRRQVRDVRLVVGPEGGVMGRPIYSVGDVGTYVQTISTVGVSYWPLKGPHLPISAADRQIAQQGGSALRTITLGGAPYRMLTEVTPGHRGYAEQIAEPVNSVEHQLSSLRTLFLLLTVLGLGLVAGGSWLVVRRTMRPVKALTDAVEQIAVTRDLTTRIDAFDDDELGRLARSFNAMLDALDRSLGAQRQLVLDASHELRTPLASLRTNAELLNEIDAMTPEQRRATLDGIVAQLDELTGLVADVVELARGEAPPATHEDVALDDLVVAAVGRSRRHWREVRFEVDTQPVTVRGTPARLDRAIANLLDNAGKFSPPGSLVEVDLSAAGVLTVADRGPGIPAQALPHVFDRFYRADAARALPGSGLGLAIVKQIVDGHGGQVQLLPRGGGGTVARLILPVVTRAEPETVDEPAEPDPAERPVVEQVAQPADGPARGPRDRTPV